MQVSLLCSESIMSCIYFGALKTGKGEYLKYRKVKFLQHFTGLADKSKDRL